MTDRQIRLDLRPGETTAGKVLSRIRRDSRDEAEKGRWFENLVSRILLDLREYEVSEVHRWADWPEREELTGRDGRDIGIDLVARRTDGAWVAIQCKCYAEDARVGMQHISTFLAISQREPFSLRWIVATCPWTRTAEESIHALEPSVRQIDFLRHQDEPVAEEAQHRPVQQPWRLQAEAIDNVVQGFASHDRGRLVMACGTGKTFTALRIAERIVPEGGRILFLAPSIALVSQARREWLRHTVREVRSVVVCSDHSAGGRGEREDIGLSELECPVTTDPAAIASELLEEDASTKAVFCTYQSLVQVTRAQFEHGAPAFDLTVADEAHRTTGVDRAASGIEGAGAFQAVHSEDRLRSRKRLYMTATPRLYTASSRAALRKKGIETVDMGDFDVYGPEFHRLSFSSAVNAEMLSDYRVIVLGVHEDAVSAGLRGQLVSLGEEQDEREGRPLIVRSSDITRVIGTSLAINGAMEGRAEERPGQLFKTLGFANSIVRSKFFARAMNHPQVKATTTRRIRASDEAGDRAMPVESRHLDASSSALDRNRALRDLDRADSEGTLRLLCNVKLFAEGVDVPSLNAVAFMEPRDSQVDVVQAVGRVMRKAPGKRFGYIVVPIPVDPGSDIAAALEKDADGYRTLGRVLRALQAHDSRLAENPLRFVQVQEVDGTDYGNGDTGGNGEDGFGEGPQAPFDAQGTLDLQDVSESLYAQVVAASGLGRPGLLVSQEIEYTVKAAARLFEEAELEQSLADALGLAVETDGGAKGVCTIAALLLANACLLHRRLCNTPNMQDLPDLNGIGGAADPARALRDAWLAILERDYKPVFEPALAVLDALPPRRAAGHAVRTVAECANRIADSLSELGYDHAGPLYHRILGSARSDGAFYTNNISALMLARLALNADLTDWSDPEAVARLRIIDPACGTGTLLMAALQTIKARVADSTEESAEARNALHKHLVEEVLCGLDINQHGIQLAACNMTLGAPTVDYAHMNLVTMPHGPQADGSLKAGSLEILTAADDAQDLHAMTAPRRSLKSLDAAQVAESEEIRFPLHDLDAVIVNAPFTDNRKRSRKFGVEAVKEMQRHELDIRDRVQKRDPAAGGVITTNSISTFFTPLAERLLQPERGILAKVVPATACTGASGVAERRFLAERFHIERIVTTHDPKRINFSENTSIHECLLVCRRHPDGERPPTAFASLRVMPNSAEEAIEAADAIVSGSSGYWGNVLHWPADRVRSGDWTPVQWFDSTLAQSAWQLERNASLEPGGLRCQIGPAGQRIQDAYEVCDGEEPEAIPGFHSASSVLRRTMLGEPDVWYRPKATKRGLADRYRARRSHLLVPMRLNTVSGRLTGLWTAQPSFGWWVPVAVPDEDTQKALAAWWNSTPVRLMLLNRRAQTLTYPTWQLEHLREIRIPRPDSPGWASLRSAFNRVCDSELLPMRQAEECAVRAVIDEAAALALGVEPDVVADWRRRLAAEPTVCNQRAADPTAGEDRDVGTAHLARNPAA